MRAARVLLCALSALRGDFIIITTGEDYFPESRDEQDALEKYEQSYHATKAYVPNVEDIGVAQFPDADLRGPQWYDDDSSHSIDHKDSSDGSPTSLEITDSSEEVAEINIESSFETTELRLATRKYRSCTPCPSDMIRSHRNLGLPWLCARYQRARRSFKSLCMMRFRNCQDGTMFVKLHDNRCKDDVYHGRHWFYIYRT